jgi:hypothetical protein
MSNLSLNLAINEAATQATVTDTSNYDGVTIGLRSDYAVFFGVYKTSQTGGRESIQAFSNDENPLTDNTWLFDVSLDGRHELMLVAIPEYDVLSTYDKFDAVYDSVTNAVYRSTQDGNTGEPVTNAVFWEPIPEPWVLADNTGEINESQNIESLLQDRVIWAKTAKCFFDFVAANALKTTDAQKGEVVENYELLGLFVDAMYNADNRGLAIDGEVIALKAKDICNKC